MKRRVLCALCSFVAGAVGYCALETLWRGRTHVSMAITGGAVLAVYQRLCERCRWSRLRLCAVGCGLITAAEFCCGCIVNRLLKLDVWDYSHLPGNVLGQICPGFCGLWFLLCLPMQGLSRLIGRHIPPSVP